MTSPALVTVPCAIWRGGTSKGLFLHERDVPPPGPARDALILRLFGSPDLRQIDGLGGADPLTSKVAIIGPSTRADADVDYTYGMVSLDRPLVSWNGTCGNISAAVGPFALDAGLVPATEGATPVAIHSVNTHSIIRATVPVRDGRPLSAGSYRIDGVPGTGARIDLDYAAMAGAVTGHVLPTGQPRDTLQVPDLGPIDVSIVDVANPEVFVEARNVGLTGLELPGELTPAQEQLLEHIRGLAAARIGLATSAATARVESANIPHLVIVSPPASYTAYTREAVVGAGLTLVSRVMFMQSMHKAYPGTGSICTAVACQIPGTVAHAVATAGAHGPATVVIGHPSGTIDVDVTLEADGAGPVLVHRAVIGRTARKLMDGRAYLE